VSFDAASEKNPDILRQAVQLLEAENRRLLSQVVELTRELAKARNENESAALQLKLAEVQAQLDKREQMLFGASSEKRGKKRPDSDGEKQPGPSAENRHKGSARVEQPQLEIKTVVHDLDEADKACKACGGALSEWPGKTEGKSQPIPVVTLG
jgi:hypothetical protein